MQYFRPWTTALSRPARPPGRSGSASTPCGAGTARAGSAFSGTPANRRLVPAAEVERLLGRERHGLSARNRFRGVVREVKVEGLLAQVELDVTEPARLVAVITRESAEELGLKPGMSAAAVVKATSVMIDR